MADMALFNSDDPDPNDDSFQLVLPGPGRRIFQMKQKWTSARGWVDLLMRDDNHSRAQATEIFREARAERKLDHRTRDGKPQYKYTKMFVRWSERLPEDPVVAPTN